MTIYEAVNSDKEDIEADKAVGRTAADFVYAFPPDIPVIIPGETVTKDMTEELFRLKDGGATIIGLKGNRITVVC
ncbi:MAG: hypothetical protein J6P45_05840 [Lachnospiraceae bacterium]|nr:hypothetical protein [Lachnospiraceae bacterium]MBR1876683.1 hypothetical protein [Lachnospiraceae bacterium]